MGEAAPERVRRGQAAGEGDAVGVGALVLRWRRREEGEVERGKGLCDALLAGLLAQLEDGGEAVA